MVSPILEREYHQQLEHLALGQQRQVLDFARALASSRARGVAGSAMLRFAGAMDFAEAKSMSQTIADGCEKVDAHGW